MKKIIFVTGARSEYDLLYSVLKKLNQLAEIDLSILVTGAHLSEQFGKTLVHIEQDGFKIADKVYNLVDTNEKIGRVISLGHQIPAFAQTFIRLKPDVVMVAGDREEAISTAITAAYMGIVVAHFFGGDIAKDGNIDNSVRYATSKFAHLHFTTHPAHADVLRRLGEEPERIFVVGNPALDRFLETPVLDRQALSTALQFDITQGNYLVLVQHAIITEYAQSAVNIRQTLDAIVATGCNCLINYPNSDAGNYEIIKAYQEYAQKYPQLFLFQNLERTLFINVLRHAACLVGNSSLGILEAPSLGLPVVNVGSRQRGRLNAGNVIFTDYDTTQILAAIQQSLFDMAYRQSIKNIVNPYGDGHSAEKIVTILKNLVIDEKVIYKNITY
ncbi:UDP-N-acetyl-D-glucosamine 2-epimerase, UDP-hydrolysing [Beggiatoa alba B18LD]|uniref:UDP-N-acetyl-D-glucosamine 2-epimerase, UDP-hydrolysing n=1 Tax=Beggiatoa alba B18LD TaxID=395493 RepID=I3CKR3_9GAMM|nr:UDP-N-acetylglucosamine 2-epimerase [Beggiatoa alba]EIJ44206.1 UDP-N-acetyl-D-glucosamine 2-epimerase, UDP-hydrolysing [Beggiatoa alba B18LD]